MSLRRSGTVVDSGLFYEKGFLKNQSLFLLVWAQKETYCKGSNRFWDTFFFLPKGFLGLGLTFLGA